MGDILQEECRPLHNCLYCNNEALLESNGHKFSNNSEAIKSGII